MAKLKIIKQADLGLLVDGARNKIDDFMELVEYFVKELPELAPDVWDTTEPFKRPFSIEGIRNTLSSWPNAQFDFDWKRKVTPKAWGSFTRLYWGKASTRHASLKVHVDITRDFETRIIEYLKKTALTFNGHYGYLDSLVPEYRAVGIENGAAPYGTFLILSSHHLQECLPDICWCQVFGKPYVELFGLEKLLSVPAYIVEQLGPELVYIQLTESLFDVHEDYERVDTVRKRVKDHLDDNIFFKRENPEGHTYRVPDFNFPPDPTRLN